MEQHPVKFFHAFLKPVMKRLCHYPADIIDRIKRRNGMIPPSHMIFIGSGDFEKTGLEFRKYFIDLAGLQPSDKVLDVGCGLGRMAVPLTSYLSREGEYWGFDIVKKGITWCQNRISKKFENFHFRHSNVYNRHYNRHGRIQAKDFEFPFETGYFDFVFLTSVFTHMLPSDLENYLSEISRVLKPGGKCLITFFLHNDESAKLVHAHGSALDFSYRVQGCLTVDIDDPESAIAYDEEFILGLYAKYSFEIRKPVYYGSWCNRDTFLSYQDLVIAKKKGRDAEERAPAPLVHANL